LYNLEEIIEFVKTESGSKEVFEDSDIDRDLGCTGDDFSELIEKYSITYHVEMSQFLWYFHHHEEGNNFGSNFFRAPNELVDHIAVTPKLLFEFAKKGKWDLKYPEHKLTKRRYDLIANQILFIVIFVILIYFWFT
jgi:Protein of unknown function (DUF1493)